jgi:thiamine-phosphate pyrophosphorylase
VTVREHIRGFYAVLDRDDEALARSLVGVGGARVLQVRIKGASASELLRVAKMARRVCADAGAMLIVNDRVDVAMLARADGVHLGQTDAPIEMARTLGARIVGISTHDVAQVERAVAAGADYLGFGPVFATATKANPDPVQGLAGLRAAVAAANGTPIVAIGGITPAHAADVYAAGAAAICAISAVNNGADVGAIARTMGIAREPRVGE